MITWYHGSMMVPWYHYDDLPWHHDDKEDEDKGGEYVTSEVLTIRSDTINRRRSIPNRIAPSVLSSTTTMTPWHNTMTPQYNDTMTPYNDTILIQWHHINTMTPRHYNVMIISIGSTAFQTVYIRTRDIYHLQLFDNSADVGSLDQYRKVRLQKQKVSYAFLCFILQCTVYTLKSMLLKSHHNTDMSVHIWVLYMVCRPRDQGVPTWTDCLGGASAPRQKGIVHFEPRGKSRHCPGTQWRIC